jgi:FkbM family methyltransferase
MNIQAMQCALWPEHGRVKLSDTFRDGQEWSLHIAEDSLGSGDIEALTLREIMTKGDTQSIDVLKIDIEGAEKFLLGDTAFVSELKKVKFLAIELHEESVDKIQVIKQLSSLGFELTYKGETLFGVNLPAIENP